MEVSRHQGKMYIRTRISQKSTKKLNSNLKNKRKAEEIQFCKETEKKVPLVWTINQTNLHSILKTDHPLSTLKTSTLKLTSNKIAKTKN